MNKKEVNMKKIFSLTVLILVLFSLSLSFVMAEEGQTITTERLNLDTGRVFGSIRESFSRWENGEDFSLNFAKYLFLALISMLVYSVSSYIPGLDSMFKKQKWMGAIFSIIVGFLSMAFITPQEVYVMMTSYTALGYVLGGFLPFIILLFFTINMATSAEDAQSLFSSKIISIAMWLAFTVFLIVKAFTKVEINGEEVNRVLQWTLAIAALAVTLSIAPIFRKIRKAFINDEIDNAKETVRMSTARDKINKDAVKDLSN